MSERFFMHRFANGITLLVEELASLESACISISVPAGVATDPEDAIGVSAVLGDLVLRGAGPRDSRALTDHLDSLGLHRSSGPGTYQSHLSATGLAPNVLAAIPVYADILRRAHLGEEAFEASRDLAGQAVAGIDDDPRQQLMTRLKAAAFPGPVGRNSMGVLSHLEALTVERARAEYARRFTPRDCVIAVAGSLEFGVVRDTIGAYLGDWSGPSVAAVPEPVLSSTAEHLGVQSEQTHIGLAWPTLPETHADYYVARVAVDILGGGMSCRLFSELREKRALCYAVYAGYQPTRSTAANLGYVGTAPARAQESLETFLAEVRKMRAGVSDGELARAKVSLKSATIFSCESTAARAASIGHDHFVRGRLRTIDEIAEAIDAVTPARINAFLASSPLEPMTLVTVGPEALKV